MRRVLITAIGLAAGAVVWRWPYLGPFLGGCRAHLRSRRSSFFEPDVL